MSDFWKPGTLTDTKPLTLDDLQRAWEALSQPRPPHQHLTSLRALERVKREGGCLRCVECGAVVCADG